MPKLFQKIVTCCRGCPNLGFWDEIDLYSCLAVPGPKGNSIIISKDLSKIPDWCPLLDAKLEHKIGSEND